MKLSIENDRTQRPPKCMRVVLDLLDGNRLKSEVMSYEAARKLKTELHRRIFEIGEGIMAGTADRE